MADLFEAEDGEDETAGIDDEVDESVDIEPDDAE